MKKLLLSLLVAGFTASALADIQDPPGNDYGPTRKYSRAVANLFFGITEIPYTIAMINDREGNAAAWSYGVVKGWDRAWYRAQMGWYELFTWAAPVHKGTYKPPYRSNIPWIHGGYEEFPPELGFESRYRYVRYNPVY
jgi:putative exosortase-associated protein (TIGR04073 family)